MQKETKSANIIMDHQLPKKMDYTCGFYDKQNKALPVSISTITILTYSPTLCKLAINIGTCK